MTSSSALCPPLVLEDLPHQLNNPSTPIPSRKKSPLPPSSPKQKFFVVEMVQAKNQCAERLILTGNYEKAIKMAEMAEELTKRANIELSHQIFISQKIQAFAWIKLSEIHSKRGEYASTVEKSFKSEHVTQKARQYDPNDPQVHLLEELVFCELACAFNQEADALVKKGTVDQALVMGCLAEFRARKGLKNPFISQNVRSLLECQLVHAVCINQKLLWCQESKY